MKKAALILFLTVTCILLCCCGGEDVGDGKSTDEATVTEDTSLQEYVCTPVRFREYVHFTTNSETAVNKFFSSYGELEAFVKEGGLLRDQSTSYTHSMNGLLNFFSQESFEENVVVLFIAPRADWRYRGDISRVSGSKERIEVVFDRKAGERIEVKDYFSLAVALMLPKEYCGVDTEFVFLSENLEETVFESDTARATDLPSPEVTEPEQGSTEEPAVKLPLDERVTSLADIDKLDAPLHKIEAAKAFLSKDLKKLDELCGYGEAVYQRLSDVEISGFEVWCQEREGSSDNDLFMNVTVSSVGYEFGTPLREGRYTLTVSSRVGGICIENTDNISEGYVAKTETEKVIIAWLGHMGYKFDRHYHTGLVQAYVEFVHSYYKSIHGEGGTKETYEKYYKTLFGVDVSKELENYLTFENGGKAEIRYGHGGSGFYYDIVESGADYVTVQFYADRGKLVYGPRIKYTFTRVDGILIPLCYIYEYGENIKPDGFAV